jgi:hypothetical protein
MIQRPSLTIQSFPRPNNFKYGSVSCIAFPADCRVLYHYATYSGHPLESRKDLINMAPMGGGIMNVVIETERLYLRELRIEDLKDLAKVLSDIPM